MHANHESSCVCPPQRTQPTRATSACLHASRARTGYSRSTISAMAMRRRARASALAPFRALRFRISSYLVSTWGRWATLRASQAGSATAQGARGGIPAFPMLGPTQHHIAVEPLVRCPHRRRSAERSGQPKRRDPRKVPPGGHHWQDAKNSDSDRTPTHRVRRYRGVSRLPQPALCAVGSGSGGTLEPASHQTQGIDHIPADPHGRPGSDIRPKGHIHLASRVHPLRGRSRPTNPKQIPDGSATSGQASASGLPSHRDIRNRPSQQRPQHGPLEIPNRVRPRGRAGFGVCRPGISVHAGHLFRSMPAACFG